MRLRRVVVEKYDPRWPVVFEQIRQSVCVGLSGVAISIEHVGSTAVPGLASKPVIDVDVVVAEGDVRAGIAGLESLGYRHRGDLGIPTREAFRAPEGAPRHHLYLCPSNSPALANHLAIRDYLRTNAQAAAAYGELKRELARRFPGNVERYVAGKTDFLVGILSRVGFSESALAEIERINDAD